MSNILQVTVTPVYPPQMGGDHRRHGIVKEYPLLGDNVRRFSQGCVLTDIRPLGGYTEVAVSEKFLECCCRSFIHNAPRVTAKFDVPYLLSGVVLKQRPRQRLCEYIEWSDVILVEGPEQAPAVQALAGETPVVYSSHNVELERYEYLNERPGGGVLYEWLTRLETAAVTQSDTVFCTSERDRELFQEMYDPDTPLIVVPNGVPRSSVVGANEPVDKSLRDRFDVASDSAVAIFLGSGHPPNVDAVERLLGMAEELEGVHLFVVGMVGESIDRSIPSNVTVTGFVEDVERYFHLADLGLNPITWGGGTNIKLLEYMAHGIPTVTTEFGARGIHVHHGEEVLLSNVEEFPASISRLSQDRELRKKLSQRSKALIEDRYTWRTISRQSRRALNSVLEV